MNITSITSYLVFPGKNQENPLEVQSTTIPLSGSLYIMLSELFSRSDRECQMPIRFVMSADGKQENEARGIILEYVLSPSNETGIAIASRLRDFTTNKSGIGLLFFLLGNINSEYKFVLSRFPANQGIIAETRSGTLEIEYIERIFMKSAASYKAALYKGKTLDKDFWSGFAVDKQLNGSNDEIANYWIREFLKSDLETTSKAGTKRFALALRQASNLDIDLSAKQEIVALSYLVSGLSNQVVSIEDIVERYKLSNEARTAIVSQLPYDDLKFDNFQFDKEEFSAYASYSSVELHTGGMLLAPSDRFNECFEREAVNSENNEYRFTTTGQIVDERVRGRR